MDLLMTILLLMVCLLISNIASHYNPSIPTALTQIVLGIIIAFVFKHNSFELEEEWFFLLFVAPILYNDGKYFPRKELWKMRRSIFGNSLILVGKDLFENPMHPYTKMLLESIPVSHPKLRKQRLNLEESEISLKDRKTGCKFCNRCSYAKERCRYEIPVIKEKRI